MSTHYTAAPPASRMRYVDAGSADPWTKQRDWPPAGGASSSNVPPAPIPQAARPVVRTNLSPPSRAAPPPSASVRPDQWSPVRADLIPPPPPPLPAGVSAHSPSVWEGATSKFPPPPPVKAAVPPGANAESGGREAGSSSSGLRTSTYSTEYVLEHMSTLSIAVLKEKIAELGLTIPAHILEKVELVEVLQLFKDARETHLHPPVSPTSEWELAGNASAASETEAQSELPTPVPLSQDMPQDMPMVAPEETQQASTPTLTESMVTASPMDIADGHRDEQGEAVSSPTNVTLIQPQSSLASTVVTIGPAQVDISPGMEELSALSEPSTRDVVEASGSAVPPGAKEMLVADASSRGGEALASALPCSWSMTSIQKTLISQLYNLATEGSPDAANESTSPASQPNASDIPLAPPEYMIPHPERFKPPEVQEVLSHLTAKQVYDERDKLVTQGNVLHGTSLWQPRRLKPGSSK